MTFAQMISKPPTVEMKIDRMLKSLPRPLQHLTDQELKDLRHDIDQIVEELKVQKILPRKRRSHTVNALK